MRPIISTIAMCTVFFVLRVTGQSLEFRQLGKEDGLSQSSVFAITQDEYGFMWFGTRNGLNKYDGYRFTVYQYDDEQLKSGLPGNDIRALHYDSTNHELWVGTLSGLSKYDPIRDRFTSYRNDGNADCLASNYVRSVYQDRRQRLWVGTEVGLQFLRPDGATFTKVRGSEGIPIYVIHEDPDGKIWVGGTSGLYRLEDASSDNPILVPVLTPEGRSPQLPDYDIRVMLTDADGHHWIGTHRGGLVRWMPGSGEVRVFQHQEKDPYSLSHNQVRSLSLSPDGSIWVGTFVGLNSYRAEEDRFIRHLPDGRISGGLSNRSIRSLYFDERGAIWVGTYHGGINYHEPSLNRFENFRHRPDRNSLSHDVVSSFVEDEDKTIWVGTEGGSLNRFDPVTQRFHHYSALPEDPLHPAGSNIKTLLREEDTLWIGNFEKGLDRMNLRTGRFSHYRNPADGTNGLSNDNVYSLLREDDRLWIATFGGGLNILDLTSGKFHHFRNTDHANSLSVDLCRVVFQDDNQRIWVGSSRGLNLVLREFPGELPQGFHCYLPEVGILSIAGAPDGKLWIGTFYNGLYQFNPKDGTYLRFDKNQGLPGRSVFGIVTDEQGDLWLSTENGLSQFDPVTQQFTNYNHSNGLVNLEFNFNAHYRLSDGRILFGGTKGFTIFNPANIEQANYMAPVVFTGLRHFNEQVAVGEENGLLRRTLNDTDSLNFAYNEANFSIQFAALDYLNPGNNRYAYIMEGLDGNWTETRGINEVSYTIQRPGEYRFRLRAGNSEGVWNEQERELLIVVASPPWRSGWAYALYGIILLGGGWGFFHFIRMRHRMQLEQVSHAQRESLHASKMRFFTNITHEFRTPLTLILGPLEELTEHQTTDGPAFRKLQSAHQNARRLLTLVNQLLTFRKLEEEGETLAAAEGNFIKFAQEIYLSFVEHARMRSIRYEFITDRSELPLWYDRNKLEKVLYNLLSNAFKFTPDGGRITVRISQNQNHALLSVEDNGPGIDPALHERIFQRFYESEGAAVVGKEGSGIGLAITKLMVELHRGSISVVSLPGKGSVFTVELPLDNIHLKPEEMLQDFRDSEDIAGYPRLGASAEEHGQASLSGTPQLADSFPSLLIVEDNPDVREYISSLFTEEYRVTTAVDGIEGWSAAVKLLPDMIISDVMMPRLDGINFCRRVKTDLRTSHIPVILLTARTGTIFRLEGLETGADGYVNKPFGPQELQLRVRNLLLTRWKIRQQFAQVSQLEPKEITITSADERFLSQAIQVVEDHIDQVDFSVDQFAYEMAVSRAILFTKIKALTDLTPNNFLKSIRLKRAAQLLRQNKLGVAEVAYRVGFRDPRYFRKCFQKAFEKNPSDYAAEAQRN